MADLLVADVDDRPVYLPELYVTDTGAILAQRGAGKSNTAVVIAEGMYDLGHQWVAIDAGGDWWGVRADGDRKGLPIPILGGLHGDIQITPDSGPVIADLVTGQRITCVIDVSDFETKAQQVRFLTDFGRKLFANKRRTPGPIHLFLEEADEFLPQTTMGEKESQLATCISVWNRILKLGRKHGIGATLITQRSATLNKTALSQIGTLFALRTFAELDRKAIEGWVKGNTSATDLVASLDRLAAGEAWIVSPHFARFTGRVQFRRRGTFDSGATPELGQTAPAPPLESIDLGAVAAAMADVAAQAAEDDPKALRRQIADLRARITELEADGGEQVEVRVEVPMLSTHERDLLDRMVASMEALPAELRRHVESIGGQLEARVEAAAQLVGAVANRSTAAPPPAPAPDVRTSRARRAQPEAAPPAAAAPIDGLSPKAAEVLTNLAQFPAGRTRKQVLAFTGMGSSTLDRALAELRAAGLVNTGTPLMATPDGLARAGDVPPAPTGPQLVAMWKGKLKPKATEVLDLILAAHPQVLTRQAVLDATGMGSSTLDRALAELRRPDLINGMRVTPELVE